jgi:hypothetical protein
MEIKVGDVWRRVVLDYEVTIVGLAHEMVIFRTKDDTEFTEYPLVFLSQFKPVPDCTVGVSNAVDKPQHYQVFPDKEAIEIIASSMTTEQFYGYCLGNFLKYRLRIGAKDEVQQELGKSNKYKELYEKHKHLCK